MAYCGFLSSFFFVLPIEFRIIPCHSWNQAVVFTSPGFDRLLGPLGCAETNRKRLETNLFTSQAFRKGHHHGSQHLCKATVGLSRNGFSIAVPATKTTTFRRRFWMLRTRHFATPFGGRFPGQSTGEAIFSAQHKKWTCALGKAADRR